MVWFDILQTYCLFCHVKLLNLSDIPWEQSEQWRHAFLTLQVYHIVFYKTFQALTLVIWDNHHHIKNNLTYSRWCLSLQSLAPCTPLADALHSSRWRLALQSLALCRSITSALQINRWRLSLQSLEPCMSIDGALLINCRRVSHQSLGPCTTVAGALHSSRWRLADLLEVGDWCTPMNSVSQPNGCWGLSYLTGYTGFTFIEVGATRLNASFSTPLTNSMIFSNLQTTSWMKPTTWWWNPQCEN